MSLDEEGASRKDCGLAPIAGGSDHRDTDQLITRVLNILSDGRAHQRDVLCNASKLSARQLANCLSRCESIGLPIEAPQPELLQWISPVELLSPTAVSIHLGNYAQKFPLKMEFPFSCGSTNTDARDLLAHHPDKTVVVATEFQASGKGTRGRAWRSGAASGLCFSIAVEWPRPERLDSSLTLAIGVAVAASLSALSDAPVQLKWPNDLIVDDAKLGGILVETSSTASRTVRVVIGVGINIYDHPVALHRDDATSLPATSLAKHCTTVPGRNALLADLITRISSVCESYRHGTNFSLVEAYAPYDYLQCRPVQVMQKNAVHRGMARGINEDGALLVEIDGEQQALFSGDVRVRKV